MVRAIKLPALLSIPGKDNSDRETSLTGRPGVISLQKIDKRLRVGGQTIHALDAVDLDIAEGEFSHHRRGRSGSGKSTLLNMLGCMDRPDGGRYLLDGAGGQRHG